MKTVSRRRSPHQEKQLKDEMSVESRQRPDGISLAGPAEAMEASDAAGESRDGQLSEVLKNQNMLHIMSENEKDLSHSLGVNQFTDLTKEECESTYLGYKHQNVEQVGHHIRTIPLRWWHSGSCK